MFHDMKSTLGMKQETALLSQVTVFSPTTFIRGVKESTLGKEGAAYSFTTDDFTVQSYVIQFSSKVCCYI
jgi:hypothetical protein